MCKTGAESNNKVVSHRIHTEDELQVRQPGINVKHVAQVNPFIA
jgi:hypothetical protein